MNKALSVLNLLDIPASIAGVVCFFLGFPSVTYICAVVTILNSFAQVLWGDQNNFRTELFTVFAGLVIAVLFHRPIALCVAFALCAGSLLFLLIGWLGVLFFLFKK